MVIGYRIFFFPSKLRLEMRLFLTFHIEEGDGCCPCLFVWFSLFDKITECLTSSMQCTYVRNLVMEKLIAFFFFSLVAKNVVCNFEYMYVCINWSNFVQTELKIFTAC